MQLGIKKRNLLITKEGMKKYKLKGLLVYSDSLNPVL